MKKDYVIEDLGTVTIDYNSWTGKFLAYLNNEELKKTGKKTFIIPAQGEEGKQETLFIDGNMMSGLKFILKGKLYYITPKMPWYAYLFFMIPFMMVMVLGNMSSLADRGFYFVGGAIGGGIGGVFSALTIYSYVLFQKWYFRVLASLVLIALTFLICWGIGTAIVSSMAQ